MDEAVLLRYAGRAPRYTSYPTAPHFTDAVDAEVYRRWLAELDPAAVLSLYLHVPFCHALCWFCGCQTTIVNRYRPVAGYLALLALEIDRVAEVLGPNRAVGHVHLGGGTPSMVRDDDLAALMVQLRRRFAFREDAEIAIEIDPRTFAPKRGAALAAAGVTRVSLGVQDFAPVVQDAVNRLQPFELTERVVAGLRGSGIEDISFDLMFGLPHQTVPGFVATVEQALALGPARICLFGYAHVPWMRRHQSLMDESALPDPAARLILYRNAFERITSEGYVAVGLDHFARADDALANSAAEGCLHRNFQGYTTDDADALLGFGASAIGTLPQGYTQNAATVPAYRKALASGGLATLRGIALSRDDRLRRAVIERLMCDLSADLGELAAGYGEEAETFADAVARLQPLAADGFVTIDGDRVTVAPEARPVIRAVCAAFDSYLSTAKARHSAVI